MCRFESVESSTISSSFHTLGLDETKHDDYLIRKKNQTVLFFAVTSLIDMRDKTYIIQSTSNLLIKKNIISYEQ